MYHVDYLQAVEPESLPAEGGIRVYQDLEVDSMGFPRVSVFGPTRDQVIDYVRAHWGDEEDPQWFAEYVVARVALDDDGHAEDVARAAAEGYDWS